MLKILNYDTQKVTDTELSIIEKINEDPHFFTSHTISELAKQYYVSESTITRMAKHIGFDSIKQLQMHVYERLNFWLQNYQISDEQQIQDLTNNMRVIYSYSINETIKNLDFAVLDGLIKDILISKRIILYGIGNSYHACTILNSNLNMIGINSFAVNDIHELLVMLNSISSQDLLIVYSVSVTTREITQVLELSKNLNLSTILITANTDLNIKKQYHLRNQLIFKLHTTENERFPSLSAKIVEILISDTIFYALIKIQPRLQEKIRQANRLTEEWNHEK